MNFEFLGIDFSQFSALLVAAYAFLTAIGAVLVVVAKLTTKWKKDDKASSTLNKWIEAITDVCLRLGIDLRKKKK